MRRLLMLVPLAVGAVTLAGAAVVPAAAGTGGQPIGVAPLTIEKEVDGHVPDGTEFTVKVECSGPAIFTPNGPVSSATVDFNAKGEADGSDTILFVAKADCTVTETHDGDAEHVSYKCEGQSGLVNGGAAGSEFGAAVAPAFQGDFDPCVTHGPQDDPMHIIVRAEGQSETVTVTNEFPDPEKPAPVPAAPVVVSPTFTG